MRVLHYSHDHYGVDNLEQALAVARRIAFDFPEATQLLVTGSPQPRGAKLPKKADYIKLPSMDESPTTDNHRPSLSLPYEVIRNLRETLITDVIRSFKPDAILVEASQEVQVELSCGLNSIQQEIETKVVLGDGDVENTAMRIQDMLVGTVSVKSTFLSTVDSPSGEAEDVLRFETQTL